MQFVKIYLARHKERRRKSNQFKISNKNSMQ